MSIFRNLCFRTRANILLPNIPYSSFCVAKDPHPWVGQVEGDLTANNLTKNDDYPLAWFCELWIGLFSSISGLIQVIVYWFAKVTLWLRAGASIVLSKFHDGNIASVVRSHFLFSFKMNEKIIKCFQCFIYFLFYFIYYNFFSFLLGMVF